MATNSSLRSNYRRVLEQLQQGKLKLYELEKFLSKSDAVKARASFAEKISGAQLHSLQSYTINPESIKGSIENMIGAVQVPVGIAGPLTIEGKFFKGKAVLPLATTEGALVASVNRGCTALNRSGGVKSRLVRTGQTRASLFEADDIDAALRLVNFAESNFSELKKTAEKGSRFLKLKAIKPYVAGRLVWLRMTADTSDAMGMNMISIASQQVGTHLEKKLRGVKYLSVSGNLCTDKKPSLLTLLEGRGRFVIAEATLPERVVKEVLKITPREMEKLNLYKNIIGSALAGSYGYNSHFANIVAALYLATGQDMAHVVEGSHGTTMMEMRGKNLNVSVTMPALQVGTVGGGTQLPAAQECIRLIGIKPSKKPGEAANQLAEVVAAAVLAGEISLLAAHASKQLVDAHRRLNRSPA